MSIKSDLLVLAFIKNSRKKFLDSYLIKSGDATSGEIFLKLSKLNGLAKIYTFRKYKKKNNWEIYGLDKWEEEEVIKKRLDKMSSIDPDIWIIELEDEEGKYPNF